METSSFLILLLLDLNLNPLSDKGFMVLGLCPPSMGCAFAFSQQELHFGLMPIVAALHDNVFSKMMLLISAGLVLKLGTKDTHTHRKDKKSQTVFAK